MPSRPLCSNILPALAVTLAVLAIVPVAAAQWEEERERERKGFTVWSRPMEGSTYREYMVELHVDAPADAVWAVLTDYEHEVLPRVEERRVLSRNAGEVVVYQRDDCDPYSPRDYALRFQVARGSEPYEVSAELAPEAAPATAGETVRVTRHHHRWSVRADGDGAVAVLIVHHDPVGIPEKLYHKGFLGSMKSMRKALQRAAQDR